MRQQRPQPGVLLGGVARELDHRDALARNRMLKRHLEHSRRLPLGRAARVVDAAAVEHTVSVGLLKVGAPGLGARYHRGEHEHRRTRPVGVVHPVDQVQMARTRGARAHPDPAGQLSLGPGRERADLLVTHVNPAQPPVPADRVADRIEAVPDHAVHALHTGPDRGFHQRISNQQTHRQIPPLRRRHELEGRRRAQPVDQVSAQVPPQGLQVVVLPDWPVQLGRRQHDAIANPNGRVEWQAAPDEGPLQRTRADAVPHAPEHPVAPVHEVGDQPDTSGRKPDLEEAHDQPLADPRRSGRLFPAGQPR